MLFAATWMDVDIVILSEVSQKRQIAHVITFMWNLKNMIQVKLFIKQK